MLNILLSSVPLAPYQEFWVCLGIVLAIIAIWQILCLVIARYILHMACTPKGKTFQEVRDRQTEVEHIDYHDFDSVWNKRPFEVDGYQGKIRGDVVFNSGATTVGNKSKVAIICHGHTMNRLNSLKYANIFYDKGYNVIVYDHRYFGESDGKFCSMGFYEEYGRGNGIVRAGASFGYRLGCCRLSFFRYVRLLPRALRASVSYIVYSYCGIQRKHGENVLQVRLCQVFTHFRRQAVKRACLLYPRQSRRLYLPASQCGYGAPPC